MTAETKALLLIGKYAQVEQAIDRAATALVRTVSGPLADASGEVFERTRPEDRKRVLRAVVEHLGPSEIPLEAMVQVFGRTRPLRIAIAHSSHTSAATMRDGEFLMVLEGSNLRQRSRQIPIAELQAEVRRLDWLLTWLDRLPEHVQWWTVYEPDPSGGLRVAAPKPQPPVAPPA